MLAAATNTLIRVFLEPVCAACSRVLETPLGGPICQACWRAVPALTPPYCVRCGDALPSWRASGPFCVRCRRRPPGFAIARSVGRYEGSLRDMVHAFKYRGRRALAEPLAARLRDAGRDLLAGVDAVVPVPLHPWRRWKRGFNQADDLARHLGRPVWPVLRRIRHGPPQASLPAGQRHAAVRQAFRVRAWPGRAAVMPLGARPLRGSAVVLVDDVMTTGATLEACSRVLIAAGVRSVRVLTVARAVTGRPPGRPPPPRPSTVRRR
jgi:ComF family protein